MVRILLAVLMCSSIVGLGYGVGQSTFYKIMACYGVAFGAYWTLYRMIKSENVLFWLGFAILLRLVLVFAFPQLSDDVYRFFWDGLLTSNGYNPYLYLPQQALNFNILGLDTSLFAELNSPDYYTVYPPISQFIFSLGAWIYPDSIYGASVVMKIVLLVAEGGTFFFLYKLIGMYGIQSKALLLYALNPLVIIEVFGNLHFEGLMFFFFIASIYLLLQSKMASYIILAGFLFTCSIAVKLHTLMFLPFIFVFISKEIRFWFLLSAGISMAVLLSPLWIGIGVQAIGSSLDLYFRNFEFNASIYYIARWIGYQVEGYNMIQIIGPLLSLLSLGGIFILWIYTIKNKISIDQKSFWSILLIVFCLFLFGTTTVHPWYLIIPIGLSVFARFRFVIVWSFLISLTYINYSYTIYTENLWVVGLEYAIVFLMLGLELFKLSSINSRALSHA